MRSLFTAAFWRTAALCSLLLSMPDAQARGVYDKLHDFDANTEGGSHVNGLVPDGAGGFYGVSGSGGANDWGNVYHLDAAGTLTVLHDFTNGEDGAVPLSDLLLARDGSLYGTASQGGSAGCGLLFRIKAGRFKTLAAFDGVTQGCYPSGQLVQTRGGSIVGTTQTAGGSGGGTLYRWRRGKLEVIHDFGATADDGIQPYGGVMLNPATGMVYGTTVSGFGLAAGGSVFAYDPFEPDVHNSYAQRAVFGYNRCGVRPFATLTAGRHQRFFVVTSAGGAYGAGTLCEIMASRPDVPYWMWDFIDRPSADNGSQPLATMTLGPDGWVYGSTRSGGIQDAGTLFRWTPGRALQVLHAFGGGADGSIPSGRVAADATGAIWGLTWAEGGLNSGTLYRWSAH